MRIEGKIAAWKGDKGFGFITPSSGEKQVFVHISSFADRSSRPKVNESVTYTLSTDNQGRPCAVDVTRAGDRVPEKTSRNGRSSSVTRVVVILLVVAIAGAFAFYWYQK